MGGQLSMVNWVHSIPFFILRDDKRCHIIESMLSFAHSNLDSLAYSLLQANAPFLVVTWHRFLPPKNPSRAIRKLGSLLI